MTVEQRMSQPARLKPVTLVLGALALGIVGAVLGGWQVPLLAGYREGLIALAVVGFAMCGSGPLGRIAATGAWLSPGGVLGTALGVLAMAIAAAGLGWIGLPFVEGERAAFVALAAVMLAKTGVGIVHRLAA